MADEGWGPLAAEIDADVRRVADRLRNLSPTRLAGAPAPPEAGMPPYVSRVQAARAAAKIMADVAGALEAASIGREPRWRELPELAGVAVGDQVAVAGHDLLAALELVGPDDEVRLELDDRRAARHGVAEAARVLADVRRRL